jgi:hypothetical protein
MLMGFLLPLGVGKVTARLRLAQKVCFTNPSPPLDSPGKHDQCCKSGTKKTNQENERILIGCVIYRQHPTKRTLVRKFGASQLNQNVSVCAQILELSMDASFSLLPALALKTLEYGFAASQLL